MALLVPSPEISSLAGRDNPARSTQKTVRKNVSFRVCSGVNDLEKKELKLRVDDNYDEVGVRRWLLKQSETAPFGSKKGKEEEEEKKTGYFVNTGYAIRTLREELPDLFNKDLTFDIYRDDIVFKDPLNSFAGIESYKSIFWALRFHGRIFFKALWVDIVSVWQPVENMIMVRWTVHGVPRIPWESRSRFDGTSEYKLDKDGKIYEHKVHNIARNGPHQKFQVISVDELIQSLGCPSTPKPTYFECSISFMESIEPLWKISAVKNYLASYVTALKSEAESQRST